MRSRSLTWARNALIPVFLAYMAVTHSQSATDNRTRIFGLFHCDSYTNTCTLSRSGPLEGGLFKSEKECKQFLAETFAKDFPPGGKQWFECRSKAVDIWQ